MKINKVSVIVPAYNEEEALPGDLEVILETMQASRWDYEVIVVNDGSTDKTAEVARSFADRGVKLLEHKQNRGGGFSRNTGIKAATGDVVMVTDGDGTYPNQDMPKMLELMERDDLDMIVGARTKEAGTMRFLRMRAKWFIRKLAEWLSGFKIPDLNSGLRAMKKDVFMPFMDILPWGHSWVSTITLAMLASGFNVDFMDIDYFPRKGTSTFHPLKDTYNYITLVIRTVTWFNPLKVFFPAALVIIAAGIIKLIVDSIIYSYFRVTGTTIIVLLVGIQLVALGLLADLIVQRVRVR
ncbi:MAG: glycosyltransferase family 2 protein [Candidatus Geothermincolia bacterium]